MVTKISKLNGLGLFTFSLIILLSEYVTIRTVNGVQVLMLSPREYSYPSQTLCGGSLCAAGFYCNPDLNLCEDAASRTNTDGVGGPGIQDARPCRGKCPGGFYCDRASNQCRRKFYISSFPT